MLEWVKTLYGDVESMSAEDFSAAVEKHGKIVDLRSGEYVLAEKFEKAKSRQEAAEAALKEAKEAAQGDEALKAEVAKLEATIADKDKLLAEAVTGKTRIERERAAEAKLADKRFTRFAVSEVEALMDDDTSFDEALASWLEANPDYAPKADDGTPPVVTLGSGPPAKSGAGGKDPLIAAIDRGFGLTEE